jgi:endo-1,4-beta-xylanase
MAYSGSQSLFVTERAENFEGATVDVTDLLEAGSTYLIGGYVRLAEGEPDSRVIMTMQRTPAGGDPTYEWIAPSAEGEITDSDWAYLEGLYSYNGEVDELLLYFESPDDALVDFYIDDVSITLKPVETGAKIYDFEDGSQGWLPRGEAFVSVSSDVAYSGSQSLLVSDRTADWHGATIDVKNLLEPDKTYDISGYVRLVNGEPDSRVIITMQRTPTGGDPAYEWIAPSSQDGVTDSEWVYLQGQYTFSGEVSELMLYVESPDEEFVDFYLDEITIVDLEALPDPAIQTDIGSVYEALSPYFLVGAALAPEQLDSERHTELLTRHFNSITAENVMKPGPIQPEEGEFRWMSPDRLVQFAKDNDMAVHGHTLVWHQQAAEWMFEDSEGNPLDKTEENKELVLTRLEEHIRAVVGRYKDDVNVWDVVNEVIDATKENCMRRTPWYELTGTDYIVTAFEVAREVAPDATLIFNDYGTTDPHKRACIIQVVQELQENGVPIDGIGMQMHINIEYPTIAAIEETIKMYADLGEVHITELDMSLYKNDYDSYDTVPDEVMLKQGYRYEELFEVLKNQAEHIGSVTFWGMADDHTWLKTFPTTRLNLPLLFDERLQAKYAYWGAVDPLQMPVKNKQVDTPKGTPTIDGEVDILWQTQSWITFYMTETQTVSYQTRWDENNLYLFVDIASPPEDLLLIDVFIDENNGKTESYEEDDRHYSFVGDTCALCVEVTFSVASDGESSRLEAALPMSAEASFGDQVGFDIRVTFGSQLDVPISWNDRFHNQDTDTSNYGTLTFVDAPRVVAALEGTPVIDGEEDAVWANANEINTEVWVLGSNGSTAVVKTLWDREYLYLYAVVTDKLLSKTSGNAYEQDSFEVFIDQNNAKTSTYQADDGQYRINYDNEATFNGGASADLLTSATKITSDGYIVELAIKFDHVEPQEGMLIGFDVQVNNDENGNGIRDSVVTWNDSTHQGYQNTSGLGVLLFIR